MIAVEVTGGILPALNFAALEARLDGRGEG